MIRILFMILLLTFCVKAYSVENESKLNANRRVYDCAANSLYVLCKLDDNEISYEKCLEWLPLTKIGNNMLEFKKALEKVGYVVDAKMVDTKELRNIKVPCIVLRDAFNENGQKKTQMGHFFVIIPQFNGKEIGIYDYPAKPSFVPVELLISTLEEKKITQFPILLCSKQKNYCQQISQSTKAENRNDSNIILIKDISSHQFAAQVDFGELPEGSLYKGYFKIKNLSKEKLFLKYLKADCKCTDITCDKELLQPGDEAEICTTVSLVKRYNNVIVNGYAVFEYNDKQIVVQLLIKGKSQPRWICKPQKVDFGDVDLKKTRAVKRLILEKTTYGKESKITRIEADSSFLLTENIISNEETYIFDLKLKPDRLSGVFSGKINIYLNNENTPATYFDVSGIVKKEFIAMPEQILLKAGDAQEVELYHCDKESFEVRSIKLEHNTSGIAIKQLPSAPDKLKLLLDAKNISVEGIHRDVLLVQVNQKGKISNVSVPVFYVGI